MVPVMVSACAAKPVRLHHGGCMCVCVGGLSYLTTVVSPFPDYGPGWADVLCLCAGLRQAPGAEPYSLFNSAGSDEPRHLLLQEDDKSRNASPLRCIKILICLLSRSAFVLPAFPWVGRG